MPTISELTLYPIKSCAGISLREATLTEAGLMSEHIYDREWMVVDAQGEFLSQREHPRMALIQPKIKSETLELRAPGMLRIEVPLGLPDPEDARVIDVRVWDDTVKAYDCDETTAAWFSSFLGTPCRLVRFHADARRSVDSDWTGGIPATTMFSDGFPLLVISEASLADLNEKLAGQGRARLPMNRFRPNVVVNGIGAFEEDYVQALRAGDAVLKPVKPCARCTIPSVDQATGERGPDPVDVLQTYRANEKVGGGITFGMNAIVAAGEGSVLRVGQDIEAELAF
ncbi:MAG TPA: MOSC N-terminal beta barrel domain-containing protein [Noviherbaspirillum sp.]|nr:MOSC N-terminal beta barrel domain-containing protein [Noviherbaspirillum sp.]